MFSTPLEIIQGALPVSELHTALNLPYVYDYITKLYKQQLEVIQKRKNDHFGSIEQDESRHRNCKNLKLGGGQAYFRSSD
jgi:hypothetical protein